MSEKRAGFVLGTDNYFHWKFAMRMMLANKGLLVNVQIVRSKAEMTETWVLNDIEAMGIIA